MIVLAAEVATKLAAVGWQSEDRAYTPHLTLARVRDGANLRRELLLEGLESAVLGQTTVAAITLFESRLSPAGAVYTVVERMELSGACKR